MRLGRHMPSPGPHPAPQDQNDSGTESRISSQAGLCRAGCDGPTGRREGTQDVKPSPGHTAFRHLPGGGQRVRLDLLGCSCLLSHLSPLLDWQGLSFQELIFSEYKSRQSLGA